MKKQESSDAKPSQRTLAGAARGDLGIPQQGALCEHRTYPPPFHTEGITFSTDLILTKHSFLKLPLGFRTWTSQTVPECDCKATGIASFFFFLLLFFFFNSKLYLFNVTSGATTDISLLV